MQINEFPSFAKGENAKLLSEPVFVGGFLWRILAMRYLFALFY